MTEKLEKIGFYTLSDRRAATASDKTPLWRCELILTPVCNFDCPYCRGFQEQDKRTLFLEEATKVVDYWASEGLQNIRFSGGEPTLWPDLSVLVERCKNYGMKHIALSTNGSADYAKYWHLYSKGINDFSISLDACCASTGELMSGKEGAYDTILNNICLLSNLTYVTVGVVLTDMNVGEVEGIVELASGLGVADIRLISAAQENKPLEKLFIPDKILNKHPILRYRYNNLKRGRHVRGLQRTDNPRCPLVLDDMAVLNGHHYPCIIYMREWGGPIGKVGPEARAERKKWAEDHDCWNDPICRQNCLDVCIDYNNAYRRSRRTK